MNSLIKYSLVILFCLTGNLLWLNDVSGAKPIKVVMVDDAIPDYALQGQDLNVTIVGSGFDSGSTVRFLVATTENDAQVEVIGDIQHIKEKSKPEKLIVPIHVLNAALLDQYDIEVTTSGGRRGKGTDLFRVEENNGSENRSETGTTECNDGIDNDGDFLIDGEDPDCYASYDRGEPKPDHISLPIRLTLDGVPTDNLVHDGIPEYVDGENHVKAVAGGSVPHRLHVKVTSGNRNQWRTLTVKFRCDPIPESSLNANDAIDRCDELAATYAEISDYDYESREWTTTGTYIFAVVPYTVNCPDTPTPCPSIFTMGESTKFMSFKLSRGIGPTIEAASDIGGGSVIDPGNCLSLMTNAQRTAFIETNGCTDNPQGCNATVTAADIDGDGENDHWRIDADGIKALICGDTIVYGQTTLTLGYDAEKK
jgi:hypothetical protein